MRTRQGETICLGERIRPASALFPPAGGVWGGMLAGFGLGGSEVRRPQIEKKINSCQYSREGLIQRSYLCYGKQNGNINLNNSA